MKILTKEEEAEHYNETITGGLLGGSAGLAFGLAGVYAASMRFPAFKHIGLPLRAFLVTSSTTFGAIVSADSYSRAHERSRNPDYQYKDANATLQETANAQKTQRQRTMDWLSDNRYSIVFGSWVASMGAALGIVGRNPYLTVQQKIVHSRMYAQGLTIAIVIISLAFETSDSARGKGRWETVKVLDPNDPEHKHMIEKKIHHESYAGEDQWRDMVEAEEERLAEKKRLHEEREKRNGNGNGNGKHGKNGKQSQSKQKEESEPKDEGKENGEQKDEGKEKSEDGKKQDDGKKKEGGKKE